MSGPPDPDMFTTPFQLTKSMHRDVYSTVDPTNPLLSAHGKVVFITGAGGGIGYNIALAWSTAGVAGIVLVGRHADTLEKTAKSLKTKTLVAPADVTSESDIKEVFEKAMSEFGKVDVLINAAGTMNQGAMIGETEPAKWWIDFESNVKGTYNTVYHFIRTNGGKGTVINIVSLGASFSFPGISSYAASKLAVIKLGELLDLENPNLRVFSIHPGMVEAENGRGMVVPAFTPFAKDKGLLTGGITLYLDKPEADHLRGGFISVNWDVAELEAHKTEIKEKKLLKLAFLNGGLSPTGYSWSQGEA